MSNNGIPPLNDWQSDNYPVIYDEGDATLKYVKTGNKVDINTGGSSYLVYTALLNQSGTDAPVATVLENTLGGDVIWSYVDVGAYFATLAGVFLENKTWMMITTGGSLNSAFSIIIYRNTNSQIEVDTYDDTENPANGILLNNSVEIRVYL